MVVVAVGVVVVVELLPFVTGGGSLKKDTEEIKRHEGK